jgi:protein TonB
MFEDSTFESAGKLKTKSKYWMIATAILNATVVTILIVIPLIYPEALPNQALATLLVAPPPPPPPEVKVVQVHVESMADQLTAPTKIPHTIKMVKDEAPPPATGVSGMSGLGGGSGEGVIGGILGSMGNGPVVKVAAPKKITVSSGVEASKIIDMVQPNYPPIAKAARIQGTVVLAATIGKRGTIQDLKVVSGPAMLQQSALDAVRRWRYRPTVLDGVPVDVDTTISVVFTLNE